MSRRKAEPPERDPYLEGRNLRTRADVLNQVASLMSGNARNALARQADALYRAADDADARIVRPQEAIPPHA
jgi:hypothetical protein